MNKNLGIGVLVAVVIVTGVMFAGCIETKKSSLTIEEIKNSAGKLSPVFGDYDDLLRYNENHVGEIIYFRGGVVQVMERGGDRYTLRVATKGEEALGYFKDVIWVNYEGDRLLENDIIDVWGKVKGLRTYEAVLGNQVTIPEVDSLHVELLGHSMEVPNSALVFENADLGKTNIILVHHGGDSITNAFTGMPVAGDWGDIVVLHNGKTVIWLNNVRVDGDTDNHFESGEQLKITVPPLASGDTISVVYVPSGDILQRVKV